jgi:hypothetical protein
MQYPMKKRWPFTKKGSNTDTARLSTQSQTDIISPKWYRNIIELPLSRFIDASVDGNLYALVKEGIPEPQDIIEAWKNIRIEYSDTVKNSDYVSFAKLDRDLTQLRIKYKQIHIAIDQLECFYTENFHKKLNEALSYNFKLDVSNPELYDAEIKRARNRSKEIKITIDLNKMTHESMWAKMLESGDVLTREYFEKTLIALSDFSEYRLRADDMSVFEYCERIRRMNAYYDSQKKK